MTGEVPEDARTEPATEPTDVTDAGAEPAPAPGDDGAADPPAPEAGQGGATDREDELAAARQEAADRTADLQRLQAEYLNYKRRVERDRELIRENATYQALTPITEVMDSIDRAREHGPLDEGFQAVADQLERAMASAGVVKYGAVGDPFDPALHDALSHIGEDPEVSVTTCKVIAKAGYKIGDRVVRAAQVLVVDPPSGPTDTPEGAGAAEPEPSPAE